MVLMVLMVLMVQEEVAVEAVDLLVVLAVMLEAPVVVVVESPTSDANMHAIFKDLDGRLSKHPEVGEYDQKI